MVLQRQKRCAEARHISQREPQMDLVCCSAQDNVQSEVDWQDGLERKPPKPEKQGELALWDVLAQTGFESESLDLFGWA
jgi:hypothetical protein